jgi:hypothetical protein
MSVLLSNELPRGNVALDVREAELERLEAAVRRQTFELSAQFAERERILLEERDRLLKTINELHHRLRRAEMIGVRST